MNDRKVSDPKRLDLETPDIAADKRAELLRAFPEARTERGNIDFDQLKRALGETVDSGKERYGLVWPGKADCFKTIQTPSPATLRPAPDESVDFDTTENLIIEGDNLEVLKLLQKSYLGKVKMIYIDPPYNTGNDFIYPDNYTESLQTYLEYTGQLDTEGRRFGTNTDADGRFHSKWLSMMYPRLYLARNLLRDDGVIFVSMNDAELSNLKILMNDVFGEENFIGTLVWKSRHNVDSRNKTGLSSDHEYVLCYGSRIIGQQIDESKYSNPDNDPRGQWMSDNMVGLATRDQRPNLHYDLENPETHITYPCPEKGWRYEKATMATKILEKRVIWPSLPEGRPRHKKFLNEVRSQFTGFSSLLDVPNTAVGTQEIRALFGEPVFDFPKPTGLLQTLVNQGMSADQSDICLDFFAGAGTTADAILTLNAGDEGDRKFILVQLPEPTRKQQPDGTWEETTASRAGYPNIAEITKERVRRVIRRLKNEDNSELHLSDRGNRHDRGFRVFKLAESNFEVWDGQVSQTRGALEKQLTLHVDHLRDGRSASDFLYEILLKSGFAPTASVEKRTIAQKAVFRVADGALVICLEHDLTLEAIRAIADQKPERVVCLDSGFAGNDQLKTNAVQTFKAKNIVFRTV